MKGGLCVAIYGLAGWINLLIAYLGVLSYEVNGYCVFA